MHAPLCRWLAFLVVCLIGPLGCALLPQSSKTSELAVKTVEPPRVLAPDPNAPRQLPAPTRRFRQVLQSDEVLGQVQVLFSHEKNTFSGLARQHDVGYQALRHANPEVDPWLPGVDTAIYLPTMSVIPDAPRDGIIVNLPSMRLLHFSPSTSGGETTYAVNSHPIGIGREGWATPTGATKVTQKARNPQWYPPASVRKEHAEMGDPLPRIVPAGPDNPLGLFTLKLDMPGYLIHGTNKPAGVGMRVSHGCIRLYPEDIESLFEQVPKQTPVYIVDQPVIAGWRGDELFLEVHPQLAEDQRTLEDEATRVIGLALQRRGALHALVDPVAVERILMEKRGLPFPILGQARHLDEYLAKSRVIENPAPLASEQQTASR